ncbi:hypothetical protein CVT26_015467 [Gymnopilus dilepis]|uniref:Uncharacterized protein n=1 Tax=Gymnopilus dilepis TaxID=231916 RepID=A0A409WHV2_9AGAR|nr:hypothetical protein CVT26_015467 [Gymnopilus dilepis]
MIPEGRIVSYCTFNITLAVARAENGWCAAYRKRYRFQFLEGSKKVTEKENVEALGVRLWFAMLLRHIPSSTVGYDSWAAMVPLSRYRALRKSGLYLNPLIPPPLAEFPFTGKEIESEKNANDLRPVSGFMKTEPFQPSKNGAQETMSSNSKESTKLRDKMRSDTLMVSVKVIFSATNTTLHAMYRPDCDGSR